MKSSGFSKQCARKMPIARIIFSIVLPGTIWLLYGSPDLTLAGNLGIFLVVVLHLYTAIWVDALFTWFRGDRFTYGMVTLTINSLSFATTFFLGLFVFYKSGGKIESLGSISSIVWGLIWLGVLATIAIPMIASRHVAPLPNASERRDFENPCDSNH